MRKIGIVIGIIAVLVIVAGGIFVATLDINSYHQTIQSQLEKRLGRTVSLGKMHLGFFPVRFSAKDLVISDDPSFNPEVPFLKAQKIDVAVKLLPLLHKQIEVNSLTLQRPNIDLIKNEAGTWNTASLGHPEESQAQNRPAGPGQKNSQSAPEPSGPSRTSAAGEEVTLSELAIRDGQVSILDKQKNKNPSLYDHIDIRLRDFAPGTPFTVHAIAHMPGPGSEQIELQGKGGPVVRSDPALTPFDGTLDFKQVALGYLAKLASSPALNGVAGTLTGQTKIRGNSGKLTAQGEVRIQNGKVQGIELGYPIQAQYDLTIDVQASLITMRSVSLKLGSTPFYISGNVNAKSMPPQLDLNLKAHDASIAELMKLAAASGAVLAPGTNLSGSVNLDVQARGVASRLALNGTISAANIEMTGGEIAQPVRIQNIDLHLTPSQIQSDPFVVTSGGTAFNTQVAMRNYTSPGATVDATMRASNAPLPAVLSLAKAYGVKGLDKVSGAGVMNLDLHDTGPVKSITATEIVKALNGTINLNLNNVKYSGANVIQEISSLGGFLNAGSAAQTAQGITSITKMIGDIVIKNGIAQTNNLQAQLDVGTIGLVGTANLLDEALDMRATTVLSQPFSQKAGGNSVSGMMNTALANKQGQLVIPCKVSGTMSHPTFTPDVRQVAQMKLKGIMPDANNPSSAVDVLNQLLGNPNGSSQAQQQNHGQKANQEKQQQKTNPTQQVLDLLQKKKPQNQPK